jgi:hypothetical protein
MWGSPRVSGIRGFRKISSYFWPLEYMRPNYVYPR